MAYDYDFVAIGGGSAGFHAARVARQFSARVALIDGAQELGGLCILRGCMPSKTVLHSSSVLQEARHAAELGLVVPEARADMPALRARKRRIIAEFADYRLQALTSGRFELIRAYARFADPHTLELSDGRRLTARSFMIATGSTVATPLAALDNPAVWTSDDVLELAAVPEAVIVLGGGFVACELAQHLARLGARVIQVQRSARLLREFSPAASQVVETVFRREGIELFTDTAHLAVHHSSQGFEVEFQHGGQVVRRRAPHLLNALGRRAATERLDLAAAGVAVRPNGQIAVNLFQQTSQPHIYAGGDCTGPYEIVHLAVQQGELAARHACGAPGTPLDYSQLVKVVFTSPPVAAAGQSETSLAAARIGFLAASYPFNDHGRSILMERKDGFVKVIAHDRDGRILGAEIAGPEAGELIHIFTVAIALRATVHDLLRAPWYHPTLAEIVTSPLEEIAEKLVR